MADLTPLTLAEAEARLERLSRGQSLQEQAAEWSGSLRLFVKHAWSDGLGIATPYVEGWHVATICEHLEAVTDGEIRRLVICVPPGSTKSTITSVCWPAWEWSRDARRRHLTASYDRRLATRFAVTSRSLIESAWYQARWGSRFRFKVDENLKAEYANDRGGRRLAIPAITGTGEHADLIIIDDPHDANKIVSDAEREACIEWHDGTITTRFTGHHSGAEVIIAQRLHEKDLIGHVLSQEPETWTVLCLPERYERKHPYVMPQSRRLPSGRAIAGDPRELEGELLCPRRYDERANAQRQKRMGAFRAAGQLQQRPAAREGAILKRTYWRFFPAVWLEDGHRHHLPRFHGLASSWDTAFKDKNVNDYVAGGLWGLAGPNVYLLASRKARMSLSQTKQAMRDQVEWAVKNWPALPVRLLIEGKANGPDIVAELKRELRGVMQIDSDASKVARAEAAEPALEGGNVYVPGAASPELPSFYDPDLTPAMVQDLIEECAAFPFAEFDDNVDQFTQVVNWSRGAGRKSHATIGRAGGQIPEVGSIAGVAPS